MLGKTQNQFSLTRAALSKGGRAKSKFLTVERWDGAGCGRAGLFVRRFRAGVVRSVLWGKLGDRWRLALT